DNIQNFSDKYNFLSIEIDLLSVE
uniref:Uncharacterized protein n=1 Tax=Amphimedon queenslandica TaxID=400682 RepID=A0A1X7VLA7_AMPQE